MFHTATIRPTRWGPRILYNTPLIPAWRNGINKKITYVACDDVHHDQSGLGLDLTWTFKFDFY